MFDAIAERARVLCGARLGATTRFDGTWLHIVGYHGVSAEAEAAMRAAFPMKLGRASINARAILEKAPVQIADVRLDPEYGLKTQADEGGWRSALAVPMLLHGEVLGGVAVCRAEPGPFPDKLVALLQTFADQAVIAIENTRRFNGPRRRCSRRPRPRARGHSVESRHERVRKILDSSSTCSAGRDPSCALRAEGRLQVRLDGRVRER